MLLGPILLTWVLMGTVSTVQCTGTDCRPTRTAQRVAGPHKMAVFHMPAACELYRQTLQHTAPLVVHSQTRPDVTVRKQITYSCQESEEAL
jgi:hypothetical protein